MLSHNNIASTAAKFASSFSLKLYDTVLSFAQLSDIMDQMFTIHVPVQVGAAVYFTEGIEKISIALAEVWIEPELLMQLDATIPIAWTCSTVGKAASFFV